MKIDLNIISTILLFKLKNWTLDDLLERDLFEFYKKSLPEKVLYLKKYPVHIRIMMIKLLKDLN